jgi:hypothetical protein
MKKDAEKRHQEVLDMIEELSEATVSEKASTVSNSTVSFARCTPAVS